MSRVVAPSTCCIAGCMRPGIELGANAADDVLCADHFAALSQRQRRRLESVRNRCERLNRIWADPERYDLVVESGRYLKLCDASQAAMEQMDAAWTRAKLAILISEAARPDAVSRPASNVA